MKEPEFVTPINRVFTTGEVSATAFTTLFAPVPGSKRGSTPPSVFNWFSPLYHVPNSASYGPEFQIYSATDATLLGNFMYTLISGLANHPTFAPYGNDMAGAVEVDLAIEQAEAAWSDAIERLFIRTVA